MELTAHPEQAVGPFGFSIGPGYPFVPTMVDLDVSWSAASAAAAPEPSRATARLWIPDGGEQVLADDSPLALHQPTLGSPMLSLFTLDGNLRHPVLGFAGRVDSVARTRSRARPGQQRLIYYMPITGGTMSWRHSMTYGSVVTSPVTVDGGRLSVTVPPKSAWSEVAISNFAIGVMPVTSVPTRSALWVAEGTVDRFISSRLSDTPSPSDLYPPADRGLGAWFWRANGQYHAVTEGPLLIGATVPSDLALVAYGRMSTATTRPLTATLPLIYRTNTPHRRPGGWWLTVSASDDLAPAARHKIGAPPWSEESALTRLQRIAQLSAPPFPVPVLRGTTAIPEPLRTELNTVRVAAIDVDNQPMLEVASKALATIGAIPYATRSGVVARRVDLTDVDTPATVTLHPDAIPDVEQSIENVDITNKITVTYRDPVTEPGEDVERWITISDQASINAWGESSARWETIATLTASNPLASSPNVIGRAIAQLTTAMQAMLRPRWTFARPVLVDTSRLRCELVLNGDYEAAGPAWLHTRTAIIESDLAHTGSKVLRLLPTAFGAAYARSQLFDVPPPPSAYSSSAIHVEAMFRPAPGSLVEATAQLAYYEVVGTSTSSMLFVPNTSTVIPTRDDGWIRVSGTIHPSPGTERIRVVPYVAATGTAGATIYADSVSAHPADPSHSCRSLATLIDLDTRHAARVSIPHDLPDVPTRWHLIGGSIAMSRGDVVVALNLRPAN